jgi:predicted alpha/beta hydrolase family esterase
MLPGLSNSGEDHWQTLWERSNPGIMRVELPDWYRPNVKAWVEGIDRAVCHCATPPVLVAHSLGCIAVAHWAAVKNGRLGGALLVAPADVERAGASALIATFAPIPRIRFNFPTILVASSNDPWCTAQRARGFAEQWGSRFVDIGDCGHINVASGFGPWPEGMALLNELLFS